MGRILGESAVEYFILGNDNDSKSLLFLYLEHGNNRSIMNFACLTINIRERQSTVKKLIFPHARLFAILLTYRLSYQDKP